MASDPEFWERRDNWEPIPRRKLAAIIGVAACGLAALAAVTVFVGGHVAHSAHKSQFHLDLDQPGSPPPFTQSGIASSPTGTALFIGSMKDKPKAPPSTVTGAPGSTPRPPASQGLGSGTSGTGGASPATSGAKSSGSSSAAPTSAPPRPTTAPTPAPPPPAPAPAPPPPAPTLPPVTSPPVTLAPAPAPTTQPCVVNLLGVCVGL